MTTERIDIVVTMSGDRVVKRSLKEIGDESKKTGDAIGFLKKALATVGVGLLLRELKNYLDVNTQITNRLKLVTSSTKELEAVQQQLYKTALATRVAYKDTVSAFARLSIASKELGINQATTARVTELLNKTVALGGSTTSEASAGMLQFAQAIASGRLQGDELRSILENLPGLAQQLAKGLGVTIGELRKLGEEGSLTPQKILNALLKQGSEIDKAFGKTSTTISQGLTNINTAITEYIGKIDKATGLSLKLGSALGYVAENIDTLAKVAGVLATTLTVALIPAIYKAIVAIRAATIAFVAANPFGAIILGITATVTALFAFREDITRFVADAIDSFSAIGTGVKYVFKGVGLSIGIFFDEVINNIIGKYEKFLNTIGGALEKLPGMKDKFGEIKLPRRDTSGAQQELANLPGQMIDEIAANGNSTRDMIDEYFKAKKGPGGGDSGLGDIANSIAGKPNAADAKKLADELKKLINQIAPADAAARDFAKGQDLLNQALRAGAIDSQEYARYTELLKSSYEDLIDPYGAVIDSIKEETALQKLSTRERAVQTELMNYENQLKREGIILSAEQRNELEQLIRLQEQATNPSPLEAYKRSLEETGDTIEETIVKGMKDASDSIAEFVLEGKGGLESFGNTLKSVAKQFLSFAIQQAVFKPLLGSFGFANGGVFQNGSLQAYANGGVVNGPTLFPMANGNVGLMGEAGAEAIMPLRRLSNGRLGVESQGGGGGTTVFAPVMNITVEGGSSGKAEDDQALAEKLSSQLKRDMENMMADFLRKQTRPGGQLNPAGSM